jgi:2-polyprenyl-3-methyl-5-hydroxy-6-metoxy-1,4-benzoquinol methylase
LSDKQEYQYRQYLGTLVHSELLAELSELYSSSYGEWGEFAKSPFLPIRLSAARIRRWLKHPDSRLAFAETDGKIIGYAISVQPKVPDLGVISWVTQLVVHKDHRQLEVGKRLLFSTWTFSDHYAWGLVTASPFAVRALEKATRRRCDPVRIAKSVDDLQKLGKTTTTYIDETTESVVADGVSRIDTKFFIDHSALPQMLKDVAKPDIPWKLGDLPEGWEWLAFTFKDQQPFDLSTDEIENMLKSSDDVARQAYSRMRLKASHRWAQHTSPEVDLIVRECGLSPGSTILDIGCGSGRHVMELAKRGFLSMGIDYLSQSIEACNTKAKNIPAAKFVCCDARTFSAGETFDAVLCVYDVVGSYTTREDNQQILRSVRRHLKKGGKALISVMNLDLTFKMAKHFFTLSKDPNRLLDLPASNTMESSGDVFNPDFYMIDTITEIVYRNEQFHEGEDLPAQFLVRDQRYRLRDIEAMCLAAGLGVVWSRFVRAGSWDVELAPDDDKAKEILLLCEAR